MMCVCLLYTYMYFIPSPFFACLLYFILCVFLFTLCCHPHTVRGACTYMYLYMYILLTIPSLCNCASAHVQCTRTVYTCTNYFLIYK